MSWAASARRTASNAAFSPGTGAVAGAPAASSRDAASTTSVAVNPLTENTDDKSADGLGRRVAFPLVEQPLHVSPLRVVERHPFDQPAGLARIVVRYRRLEMLACGRRLAKLPPQPAEKRHGCGGGRHGREATLPSARAPPSSSGLGRRPFTPVARVRIPLGVSRLTFPLGEPAR